MKLDIWKSFAETIKGQQIVGTVDSVERAEFDDDRRASGKRDAVVVHFVEYPDNPYFTNKTILKTIIAVLGDETDHWKGKQIPMERVKVPNPQTGDLVEKFYPMDAEEWPDALRAFRGQVARQGGGARKTAARKRK